MRYLRAALAAPLLFLPLMLLVVGRALILPDFEVALDRGEVEGELYAR
ncbi:MAG TPA: hypothetical protein VK610_07540 [Rhodothermales bacterium]|nr:hypothetical protein [Rhodothermales bacterium]